MEGLCITHWCIAMDESEGATYRWFVTEGGVEVEVTKAVWVAAERRAGFINTIGHPEEPATAGFSTGRTSGRYERSVP